MYRIFVSQKMDSSQLIPLFNEMDYFEKQLTSRGTQFFSGIFVKNLQIFFLFFTVHRLLWLLAPLIISCISFDHSSWVGVGNLAQQGRVAIRSADSFSNHPFLQLLLFLAISLMLFVFYFKIMF